MRITVVVLVVTALSVASATPCRARTDRRTYALSLLVEGRRRLAIGTIDQRRAALQLFERAALVAPRDPAVLVPLGDAYTDMRYLQRARSVYERALRYGPDDPDVHFGFARIHRRDWLEFAWREDLTAAVAEARAAVRLRPAFVEAWAALPALEVEAGNLEEADRDAARALEAGPDRAEAQLVAAELDYRMGRIPRADSLFRLALSRLDPAKAARFLDVTPLVSARDVAALADMTPAQRAEWTRRFWSANDPDLVTPENEAQLEYWSRQSHALLLLGDPWGPIWRERTAVYVRYGRHVQIDDPMRSQHYEMPQLDLGEVAAAPTPAQIARIGQVARGGGQSAFSPLAPGDSALRLAMRVLRFEGDAGPRVLAQVQSPGTPGSTLDCDAVVLDADDRPVARSSQRLSVSACDPQGERSGQFAFDLPPGTYRLAFAVHDTANGRGVRQALCSVGAPTDRLSMSEIAANCGPPDLTTDGGGVRLLPNPRAFVEGGDPLVAYFELYRLHTDSRGESRFEYEYQVRALRVPGVPWYRQEQAALAAAQSLAYQTTQKGVGHLRRQFIRVPTRTLPIGRYRLEVTVRDLQSGQVTQESLPFSRVWSQAELEAPPVPSAGR